ncbi:MAG: Yip1 family protein [Pseudomonadota bacterium]
MTPLSLTDFILETIKTPRDAAKRLLGYNISADLAFLAMGAMIGAYVLLIMALSGLQPVALMPGMAPMGPLYLAVVLFGGNVLLIVAVSICGRPFGGQGTVTQAVLLFAWLQAIQMLFQIAQLIVALVSNVIAAFLGLGVLILVIWILLNFIDALHNLNSLGKSALVFLLAIVGIAVGLTLITTLLGISPPTA